MHDNADRFAFPELPDTAVVALNEFLEDFYTAFQNHYFSQLHRWYHDQRAHDNQLTLPLDPSF